MLLICSGAAGCLPDRPTPEQSQPGADPSVTAPSVTAPSEPEAKIEAPTIEPSPMVPLVEPPATKPEPPAFVGRETVRVDELLAALSEEVPKVAESEAVATDYAEFIALFELADDPELYLDYVRIKIAFEATRAGGWWGLRWDITNEQPNSDEIWAAWHALEPGEPVPELATELPPLPITTATAECDELSALFAFVAQRLGLSRESEVGLFWPTGNHVVAVWTIHPKSETPVRVIVPTSQIFLGPKHSLGTNAFNPWKQKTIFDYRRQDARASLTVPASLASAFVQAVRDHGGCSQAELQEARNAKEAQQ